MIMFLLYHFNIGSTAGGGKELCKIYWCDGPGDGWISMEEIYQPFYSDFVISQPPDMSQPRSNKLMCYNIAPPPPPPPPSSSSYNQYWMISNIFSASGKDLKFSELSRYSSPHSGPNPMGFFYLKMQCLVFQHSDYKLKLHTRCRKSEVCHVKTCAN